MYENREGECRQRSTETSSEGDQGPEGVVAPWVEWNILFLMI